MFLSGRPYRSPFKLPEIGVARPPPGKRCVALTNRPAPWSTATVTPKLQPWLFLNG